VSYISLLNSAGAVLPECQIATTERHHAKTLCTIDFLFLDMIFKKRRYFTKQTFEIKKSSLKVEVKGLFDAIEYEISHEQIDNKKTVQTSINHGFLC
jgi:hypothetical protein